MTCKEKWEMENPGEDLYKIFLNVGCPSDYGYMPDIKIREECYSMTCKACWDREIPEESPAVEEVCESCKIPESILNPDDNSPVLVNVEESESKKAVELGEKVVEGFVASMMESGLNDYIPNIQEKIYESIIKDSGDRTEFESGAVRDMHAGKGRCDLMPLDIIGEVYSPYYVVLPGCSEVEEPVRMIFEHIQDFQNTGDVEALYSVIRHTHLFDNIETMLLEVAIHFENGCEKYGENNWRKGIPAKCYIDSAIRHYLKCVRGDRDERHDRAFVWNILCCIWTCVHMPELNTYNKTEE